MTTSRSFNVEEGDSPLCCGQIGRTHRSCNDKDKKRQPMLEEVKILIQEALNKKRMIH